ncbi:MAG: sulfide/dihydroorotate dehydrogenase-like FAD/NAD-binding protein [Candidatus Eisenbacteria bacterium]
MFKIKRKDLLTPDTKLFVVDAPMIASKVEPGQFIILRIHEEGERIPLTVADFNRDRGELTLIFQEVGKTTRHLGMLGEGDTILDLAGPLGKATHIDNFGTVACIGGGIGIAPVYPIARALRAAGNRVISIIGARSKNLLILENEMTGVSDEIYVTTDDGSYGKKAFVTQELEGLINDGYKFGFAVGIGPVPMMKAFALVTMKHGIMAKVSLNPIMVDGTGMCGVCRVSVGGKTMFACVDGPEFDAAEVDFDVLCARQQIYCDDERASLERFENDKCGGCSE